MVSVYSILARACVGVAFAGARPQTWTGDFNSIAKNCQIAKNVGEQIFSKFLRKNVKSLKNVKMVKNVKIDFCEAWCIKTQKNIKQSHFFVKFRIFGNLENCENLNKKNPNLETSDHNLAMFKKRPKKF